MVLESLFRECSPRGAFEICLKTESLFTVRKSNGCFDTPMSVFCCMGIVALIMGFEAILDVFCKTNIKPIRRLF